MKLTPAEFTRKAIVTLRKEAYGGIHTVYSGFNEAFRLYFNDDPLKWLTRLATEGTIEIAPSVGGLRIYLPGEMPRRIEGGMEPYELKEIRHALELSAKAMAQELGISESTMYRLEAGAKPVPRHIALAVEALSKRKEHGYNESDTGHYESAPSYVGSPHSVTVAGEHLAQKFEPDIGGSDIQFRGRRGMKWVRNPWSFETFHVAKTLLKGTYTAKAVLYAVLAILLNWTISFAPIGTGIYWLFQGDLLKAILIPVLFYIWIGLFMAFWPIWFIIGWIKAGFLESLLGNGTMFLLLYAPEWLMFRAMVASQHAMSVEDSDEVT